MTVTSYGPAARTVTRVFRTASKSITRSSNALSNYSELWSKTALASTELTKVNFNKYRDIIIEAFAYDSLSVKDVGTWTVLQQNRAKKL